MIEITVHIPGLEELAKALTTISVGKQSISPISAAQNIQTKVPAAPITQPAQYRSMPQQVPVNPTPAAPIQNSPAMAAANMVPAATPAPSQPAPIAPSTNQAPAANAPTYTLDQLAVAAAPLMDAGKGPELTAMLAQFGVQSMTQLKPEQYGAVATSLRVIGAVI